MIRAPFSSFLHWVLVLLLAGPVPLFAYDGLEGGEDTSTDSPDLREAAEAVTFAPQVRLPATFTFATLIETDETRLYLGKVARCDGPPSLCLESQSVDLGPSPPPGRSIRLVKSQIQDILRREWPDAAATLKGPDVIRVSSRGVDLDPEKVREQLEAAFKKIVSEDSGLRIVIGRFQILGKSQVRPGGGHFVFPELEQAVGLSKEALGKRYSGPVNLEAIFVRDGLDEANSASLVVSCGLTLEQSIPVTARSLERGTIIGLADLTRDWLVVKRNFQPPILDESLLVGRRAKQAIGARQPISGFQLDRPLVVVRGEQVQLQIQSGGMTVSSRVEAQGSGSAGDTIDVINPDTKKRLRARIVNKGKVEAL